jgi:acyl-CoA thioesterase-1
MKPVGMALLATLALAGCEGKAPTPPPTPASSPTAAVSGPERRIVALGDSLFAGYGLRPAEAYPVRLEAALRARGINARIVNAGVSGDTTADGLGRLDFTLGSQPRLPDLVILCLGGNDMLRALPASESKANVNAILGKLEASHVPALVMGMLAAPNLGPDYAHQFNPIFPAAAKAHHAGLVPFFLAPVIDHPELRHADHIHPTAKGVDVLVAATVDQVAAAVEEGAKRH